VAPVEHVAGAEKLLAVLGRWPSFHDAEVLWLRLDRRSDGPASRGPTLEALVHAFEMTPEVGADGRYVLRHHVLVHLRFLDVVDVRLDGFGHQNVLDELTLTELRDGEKERVRWGVHFVPSFGIDASFQCDAVEVVDAVPCNEAGEPTEARAPARPSGDRTT